VSARRRGSDGSRLGRTQVLVLHLLAGSVKSIDRLAMDWPGLTESSVRGAIGRLYERGLVDVAHYNAYNARVFMLTERGRAVELGLCEAKS
jgi:DNA-binding HxlR family transcriptional regulator